MLGKKIFGCGADRGFSAFHLPLTLFFTLPLILGAQEPARSNFVTTEAINRLRVGLTDHNGNTNASAGSVLAWTVFGPGKKPTLVGLPPQPEFAFQVELFDEKGNAVPKTGLGLRTGRRFSELSAQSEGVHMQLIKATSEAEQLTQVLLFRPSDLFTITAPGRYTLRIRFQIVAFFGNPGNTTRKLIRFAPLDYNLFEKPQGEVSPRVGAHPS